MNKLAVSIPTYNNPDILKETLDREAYMLKENNVLIYIFDSSTNDFTQNLVMSYINDKNLKNIFYNRSDSLNLDHKTYHAVILSNVEYVWLCGDSIIINQKSLEMVLNLLDKNFDIIVLNDRDREKIGLKEYNNSLEFFKECCWCCTFYGSTIHRASIFIDLDKDYLFNKYQGSFFLYVCGLFEGIAEKELKAIHIPIVFREINRMKKRSFWLRNAFDVFGVKWINSINKLPMQYDIYKKNVILKHGILAELFSKKGLLKLRYYNALNIETYIKYNDILCQISNVNMNSIKRIAKTPRICCYIITFLNRIKVRIQLIFSNNKNI